MIVLGIRHRGSFAEPIDERSRTCFSPSRKYPVASLYGSKHAEAPNQGPKFQSRSRTCVERENSTGSKKAHVETVVDLIRVVARESDCGRVRFMTKNVR